MAAISISGEFVLRIHFDISASHSFDLFPSLATKIGEKKLQINLNGLVNKATEATSVTKCTDL